MVLEDSSILDKVELYFSCDSNDNDDGNNYMNFDIKLIQNPPPERTAFGEHRWIGSEQVELCEISLRERTLTIESIAMRVIFTLEKAV